MSEVACLPWLEEELRSLLASPVANGISFSVAVWCGEKSFYSFDDPPYGWVEVAARVPQWALRRVMRHLLSRGWDTVSVFVGRNEEDV